MWGEWAVPWGDPGSVSLREPGAGLGQLLRSLGVYRQTVVTTEQNGCGSGVSDSASATFSPFIPDVPIFC